MHPKVVVHELYAAVWSTASSLGGIGSVSRSRMSAEISGHWQVHIKLVAELRCAQLYYWNAAVSKSMWAVAVIPVVRAILG